MGRSSRRTRPRSPALHCFTCCSAKSPGPWPASSSTKDAGPSAQGRKAVLGGVVKAPMPGLVVRVEVSEGQVVEVGEGLVVVEAMKMENELRASSRGVVEHIHVSAGQRVEKGAALVTIKVPEPSS